MARIQYGVKPDILKIAHLCRETDHRQQLPVFYHPERLQAEDPSPRPR